MYTMHTVDVSCASSHLILTVRINDAYEIGVLIIIHIPQMRKLRLQQLK